MKIALLLFLIAITAIIGTRYFLSASQKVDPESVRKAIGNGALIVDVRTPQEFADGHYPGSINIPLSEINDRIAEFGNKDKPIVVYCRSGNRSGKAKSILEGQGFTKVINGGAFKDMPR